MATATTPMIELNYGVELPALGLGVFQSPPDEALTAVEAAIEYGYRLVDTAAAYGNEREVGEGIRRSGIDRGEVFVTTKTAGRTRASRVRSADGRPRRPSCLPSAEDP